MRKFKTLSEVRAHIKSTARDALANLTPERIKKVIDTQIQENLEWMALQALGIERNRFGELVLRTEDSIMYAFVEKTMKEHVDSWIASNMKTIIKAPLTRAELADFKEFATETFREMLYARIEKEVKVIISTINVQEIIEKIPEFSGISTETSSEG